MRNKKDVINKYYYKTKLAYIDGREKDWYICLNQLKVVQHMLWVSYYKSREILCRVSDSSFKHQNKQSMKVYHQPYLIVCTLTYIIGGSTQCILMCINIHHMHILLEAFKHYETKEETTFPTQAYGSHIRGSYMGVYSSG